MDYKDRYIIEASGKAGLDELARSTVALAAAGERADGGLKKFSGALVQATRAGQDFAAAGMMGISNNIIEIGARLGPLGVVAGSVLTVMALNAEKVGDAFENLASRPGFDRLVDKFSWVGEAITGAFAEAARGVDAFLDAVLGADTPQAVTRLVDYETGLRRVQLQLAENRKAQDELTRSGELDAEGVAKLNTLRAESVRLLREEAEEKEKARIRQQYGAGATDEQIAMGEAFKAATKGGNARILFDVLKRARGEENAVRLIREGEQGFLDPAVLAMLVGEGGPVADIAEDYRLRLRGTNLADARKLQRFSDLAMTGLQASPFLRGGVGGTPPGTGPDPGWHLGRPLPREKALDSPAWGSQDFGAQAGVAAPQGPKAGPLGGFGGATVPLDSMADQAFGPNPAGAAKGRRGQIDSLRDKIGAAQVTVDDGDRAALAELEAAADALLRSAGSNERKQAVVLAFAQAVMGAIQGTEFSEQRLRADLARMQARLRVRPAGGMGTLGGFGGL